jgi:hypothetical protein
MPKLIRSLGMHSQTKLVSNIQICTWISARWKTKIQLQHILMAIKIDTNNSCVAVIAFESEMYFWVAMPDLWHVSKHTRQLSCSIESKSMLWEKEAWRQVSPCEPPFQVVVTGSSFKSHQAMLGTHEANPAACNGGHCVNQLVFKYFKAY